MESILRDVFTDSGLFDTVEVEHTDDPDRLLVSLCQYHPNLSEHDVADAVEELWGQRVSHPFWEAHSTWVDDGHVEFEAATREGPHGHYVTVHLVAQRSPVPLQRSPQS
ncbi:MAG TPA: hypothetical protein VK204_12180 [Nocardioidaceae bacterium]|nr:hypothetical protein [Nocardioidaceae bacterium]